MSRRDVRPTLTPWTTPKGRRRDVDDIESRTGPVLALGSKHSHAGTQGEPCSRCLYMQGWWRCSFWLLFSPEMMLIYTLNQRNPQGIADCPCTTCSPRVRTAAPPRNRYSTRRSQVPHWWVAGSFLLRRGVRNQAKRPIESYDPPGQGAAEQPAGQHRVLRPTGTRSG